MKLKDIIDILGAKPLVADDTALDVDVSGAYASDQLSGVLSFATPNAVLLTTLTHRQVVRTAEMAELAAICFVQGRQPDAETIDLARRIDVPLVVSGCDMDDACNRLYACGICDAPSQDR